MKMLGILVMYYLAMVAAEVVHEGPCPEMEPVKNFNLTAVSTSRI